MLSLRIRTIASTSRRYVRHNSSASTVSYPKQVRAYPFAFDEAEAARRASLAVILARPTDLFTCLSSYFLGTKPVQPSRVAAVYLPGWIIDADIEMQMEPMQGEGEVKPRTAVARFKNSYMPGFAHNSLSHMSFKDFEDNGDLPLDAIPWSPALEKQHSKDIACLPFTMTPFSLVKAARMEPHIKESTRFKYDPKTLKQTFLAVYPVLMPVYLLQYEASWPSKDEKDPRLVFVIVDASTKSKGRVATENSLPVFAASVPFQFPEAPEDIFDAPLVQFDRGTLTPRVISNWAKIERLLITPVDDTQSIELDLDLLAVSPDVWAEYNRYDARLRKEATGSENIDWNDLRIREYSKEETKAIELYREVRAEHLTLRDMVSTLSNMSGEITTLSINSSRSKSAVNSNKPSLRTETSSQLVSQFAEQFKHVLRLLQRTKPDWVKAWEAQHREEIENDSKLCKEEREAKAELEREAQTKAAKEKAERTVQENVNKNAPGKDTKS